MITAKNYAAQAEKSMLDYSRFLHSRGRENDAKMAIDLSNGIKNHNISLCPIMESF